MGLVTLKDNVSNSWSNRGVLVKRCHDELPKLVEICKQDLAFENGPLERVIGARSAVLPARER